MSEAKPERTPKGRWMEEFKCGCTNVVAVRNECLGYCPTHGEDRRHLTKLSEPVTVGLTR